VNAACFDHSDCLSGKCSTDIAGATTFVPIFDEDSFTPRPGVRGVCVETAEAQTGGGGTTSAAAATSLNFWIFMLALVSVLLIQ